MYKCEICGITSKPRTPAHKVLITTRATTYSFRSKANACWKWDKVKRKFVFAYPDDPGGRGRECVREVTACAECAREIAQRFRQPESRKAKAAGRN